MEFNYYGNQKMKAKFWQLLQSLRNKPSEYTDNQTPGKSLHTSQGHSYSLRNVSVGDACQQNAIDGGVPQSTILMEELK